MCSIDGQTVGPGLSIDSQGNPIPSNMRFSFWTLETMPNASPFNALSSYTGEMDSARSQKGGAVADAVNEPPQRQERPPEPVVEREPDDVDVSPPPRDVEDRMVNTETYVPPAPPPAPPPVEVEQEEPLAVVVPPPPPPEPVPVTPVPEPAPPVEPAAPAPSTGYQPPTMAGRMGRTCSCFGSQREPACRGDTGSRATAPAEPPPSNDAVAVAEPPPPPPPPEPEVVSCDDLVALESAAIMGQLGVERRKCLKASGGWRVQNYRKKTRSAVF